MEITFNNTKLRTLKPGDTGFIVQDGIVIAQRAGFEILTNCPREYKLILLECIDRGWIKPVATVYDYEQTFDLLKEK